jgi:hypothetical protein
MEGGLVSLCLCRRALFHFHKKLSHVHVCIHQPATPLRKGDHEFDCFGFGTGTCLLLLLLLLLLAAAGFAIDAVIAVAVTGTGTGTSGASGAVAVEGIVAIVPFPLRGKTDLMHTVTTTATLLPTATGTGTSTGIPTTSRTSTVHHDDENRAFPSVAWM